MPNICGSISMVAFNYAPPGYQICDGSSLPIVEYPDLYKLIGTTWGGSGGTFNVPDLRSRVLIGQGAAPGLTPFTIGQTGGNENAGLTADNLPPHSHLTVGMKVPIPAYSGGSATATIQNNYLAYNTNYNVYDTSSNGKTTDSAAVKTIAPRGTSNFPIPFSIRNQYLGINFLICTQGAVPAVPPAQSQTADLDDNYFVGEIIQTAFNFCMRNFYVCNGQPLNKYQNAALFNLLGYTFGGSGDVFNLPDFTGVQPVGMGQGGRLQNIPLGAKGGSNTVTLQPNNLPAHIHTFTMKIAATSNAGTTQDPTNAFPASVASDTEAYCNNLPADGYLGGFKPTVDCATSVVGGGQPMDIKNPVLPLNFLICNMGLYPPRS